MALITPDRLVALKAKVKAECQRRKYVGSVSSYGGTNYDFSVAAASGKIMLKEHYEKNAIPLNAITGGIDTNGARIVSDAEITAMENKVEELSDISRWASKANSGCAASCTGLCAGYCDGTCDGTCDGDCDGDCDGGCYGSCQSSCSGTCEAYCEERCSDDCIAACQFGCGDLCTGSAGASCGNTCMDGCTGTCLGGNSSMTSSSFFTCSSNDI